MKAACEFSLAVLLRAGVRQVLLMNKTHMLFHICHLSSTFDTFLSSVFNWGVHLLMLLQCKGGEELLFTVITHEVFFFAVLYPMMPLHVERFLSANLTFGADFCLVLELDVPGEWVASHYLL